MFNSCAKISAQLETSSSQNNDFSQEHGFLELLKLGQKKYVSLRLPDPPKFLGQKKS